MADIQQSRIVSPNQIYG